MRNLHRKKYLDWRGDRALPASYILFFILVFFLLGEQLVALPTYLIGPGLDGEGPNKPHILDLAPTDALHRPIFYFLFGVLSWALFHFVCWPLVWLSAFVLWTVLQSFGPNPGASLWVFLGVGIFVLTPFFVYQAVGRRWGTKGRRNAILIVAAINVLLFSFFAYQIYGLDNSYKGYTSGGNLRQNAFSSEDSRNSPEQPSVDSKGRPFNPSLSCVGHCSGYAESGNNWCFCDAVCPENGNCCSDFKTACRVLLTSDPNAPLTPQPPDPNAPLPPQPAPPNPTGLSRQYPDFVKCSWVSPPELPTVVYNLDELERLGLNSVCIMQGVREFDPGASEEQWGNMKVTTLSSIATLKRAGFSIVFILDAGGGPQAEKEYTKLTKDQFLIVVEEEALEWAARAEEYQVEYFAPANELPSKLHNLLTGYSELERQLKKNEETNTWHQYMLPKVREIFKGKVIAKLGDYNLGLDPAGYDVIAYTIGHNFLTDLNQFRREKVKSTYAASATQAKATGAEWWVGEIWFAYQDASNNPDAPLEYTTKGSQLQELQDDYHRIIIEEIDALSPEKQPTGLVVGGYAPGSSNPILTEESTEVIQNFFRRGHERQ